MVVKVLFAVHSHALARIIVTSRLQKLVCYLVISLQVMTSVAFAQGVMLCVPAEGSAHIENRVQQKNCAKEQNRSDAQSEFTQNASENSCTDFPVGGQDQTTVKVTQHAASQFDPTQFLAIIPQFLQITLTPVAPVALPRTAVDEAQMLAALPGQRMIGEVSLVSAEVDPNTRSARVRIIVENTNNKLKPGMFARVMLFAGEGEAVLAIPEEAVQTLEGSPSIFVPVAGEPNTFARRPVSIGKPVSGYVLVMSGLKEDELFVASGTFILKAELGKSEAKHEH